VSYCNVASSCLSLLSVGIIGMWHHTQFINFKRILKVVF
jgi:hypothetical protein